jgi:hypothetical protein
MLLHLPVASLVHVPEVDVLVVVRSDDHLHIAGFRSLLILQEWQYNSDKCSTFGKCVMDVGKT